MRLYDAKCLDCQITGDQLRTAGKKDGGNCLWSLVLWVACTGTVFYNALSVFSRHLFTCTLSPALTPVTQFHCTATMAYIISDCNLWCSLVMLPEASTAHDCTDCLRMCESQYSHASAAVGPPYSSVISLSRKQPWNLKPLHGRCCGHFTEAQSADCVCLNRLSYDDCVTKPDTLLVSAKTVCRW